MAAEMDAGAVATRTANGIECPACGYVGGMPLECLREHWEPIECDRCAAPFEYRGYFIGGGDFEIQGRFAPSYLQGLAAKLSKAQRGMLSMICDGGTTPAHYLDYRTMDALLRRRLIDISGVGVADQKVCSSPLGLAVRAVLRAEGGE